MGKVTYFTNGAAKNCWKYVTVFGFGINAIMLR